MKATKTANTKRLYIGNLDESINEYAIIRLFEPFGKITFIEVMVHWTGEKKGHSRGYCFLEFETKEQALKAISELHGKTIKGKPLVVSFAHMTPEQDEAKKRGQALHKPTTLSLLKGQRLKNSSTDAKIRAIEKKLNSLKQSSISPSPPPPPPSPLSSTSASASASVRSPTVNNAFNNASSYHTSKSRNRYKPY
ncbi:hypothetical protein INT46_010052 [Mucor plumbeus]|uniref:RRM domain-containing protein n=1 Tax=Mucor plumbeus TaxID=97098 RepID=A0A8H7R8H2_9FUNG|nr:hypothetical protein INT46_010052 [Mucor plumbeus]